VLVWKEEPILCIDTETTGPDPDTARVVEIALALMLKGAVQWACTWRVNPGVAIPKAASEVHGIYNEDVVEAPPFEAILDLVGLVMYYRVCAAYNAPFDRLILAREFALCGAEVPPEWWIDPLVLARQFIRIRGSGIFRLDNICSRLRIDLGELAHTATADAVASGKIISHYASQLPDDLQEFAELQAFWAEEQWSEWVAYCNRVGRDPGKKRV